MAAEFVQKNGYRVRVTGPRQWLSAEYWCQPCRWRGDSLEPGASPREHIACGKCGEPAERVISAPTPMTVWGTVQRGASDEKPPRATDTEALADGMPLHEWKARRKKARIAERHARNRRLLS